MTLAELQKTLLDTASTITATTRELANQASASANACTQAEKLASGLQARLDEAVKKAEEQAAKFAAERQDLLGKNDSLKKGLSDYKELLADVNDRLRAEKNQVELLKSRLAAIESTPENVVARRKEAELRKARAEAEAKAAAEELEKLK